jgi:hypothetical protein
MDLREQTFGVEIETVGMKREQACKLVAALFGSDAYFEGGGYDVWSCKDRKGRKWKFVYDGSLTNPQGACEIVTPILTYDDLDDLQLVTRLVRTAGAKADSSCGVHVHVGADKHNPRSLLNLTKMMIGKEDTIYKGLKVSAERASWFTRKVDSRLAERIERGAKPRTMDEWKHLWYESQGFSVSAASRHYQDTRYHGLNLHTTFNRGATVEFRMFNGTLHAGRIKAYVQFCLALSAKAINSRTVSMQKVNSVDEKHMYGCWLLRLGLEGDEFATCREHVMAGLEDAPARSARRAA